MKNKLNKLAGWGLIGVACIFLFFTSCRKHTDPGDWDIHWPLIDFSYSPSTALIGDDVSFEGQTKALSSRIVKWEWTFSDTSGNVLSTAEGRSPSYTFDTVGVYNVDLLATDSAGNTGFISKQIPILADTGLLIKVMICVPRPSNFSQSEAGYEKTADIINTYKPDFVIMRQLDSATTRNGQINPIDFIGNLTGMKGSFAKAFDYQGGGYGNGILSRFPIIKGSTLELPPTGSGEVKSMGLITVQIDGKYESKLSVAGTELTTAATDHDFQLNTLLPVLDTISNPILFGCDFNVFDPTDEAFQTVQSDGYTLAIPGNGYPKNNQTVANPTRTTDFIFFKADDNFVVKDALALGADETVSTVYRSVIYQFRYFPNE